MEKKVIAVFSSLIEIVISSEQAKEHLCVFIETAPPGGGPPPHFHDREEEVFTVLEGDFEFFQEGEWSPFKQGETRISNRGNYHAFRNVGRGAGRVMLITNGGGIDRYFEEISDLRLPNDMMRLIEISARYGYHFLPAVEPS